MRASGRDRRRGFFLSVSALTLLSAAGPAGAGGFDVREQSAFFAGMSYAGAAAGGASLSSMFWNPAAAGYVTDGLTTESALSLIIPRADLTVEQFNGGPVPPVFDATVDVGRDALVPASYMAWRYSSDLVFAMSINSQFGLGTKPDNPNWIGAPVGRSSELFSVNAAPTVAYRIAPGLQVGAGVQIQYLDLKGFKSSAGPPTAPSAVLEGDDWGFGFTAGVNIEPAPGTSIGIGYRSSISHTLDGTSGVVGLPISFPISADLDLPEKVTASLRQELAQGWRANATVEWTNWSRLQTVPVEGSPVPTTLDFQWQDGWFFALGGEYDYDARTTLRAGIGYEISPIREPSQRLVQLPDNDRVWLSAGAGYHIGEFLFWKDTTLDIAYSHVFVEDGDFERHPAAAAGPVISGSVDAAVDIVTVGLRSKW